MNCLFLPKEINEICIKNKWKITWICGILLILLYSKKVITSLLVDYFKKQQSEYGKYEEFFLIYFLNKKFDFWKELSMIGFCNEAADKFFDLSVVLLCYVSFLRKGEK